MKKLLALASSVLLAAPAMAQMSPREADIYEYGFNWGWLSSTCMAYQEGRLPVDFVTSTISSIQGDEDLSDHAKTSIFNNLQTVEGLDSCARVYRETSRPVIKPANVGSWH